MKNYVIWLDKVAEGDRKWLGRKARNLSDLTKGLNVPAGFCVSAQAYSDTIVSTGIRQTIGKILKEEPFDSLEQTEKICQQIYGLFTKVRIPQEIVDAVTEAYLALTAENPAMRVAVRSSASKEDLRTASFAGLHSTILDVEGLNEVLKAVKKCWASLWTARAIHYRKKKGYRQESAKMAVIIQEMIPAQVSGVMFTANPVNNRRNEILIEATRGLGEGLVSGRISGDTYIVAKDGVHLEVRDRKVADPAGEPLLNDYDIKSLALDGVKVEQFYNGYQDIEWAYYNGKFYCLQARPITTLGVEELPELPVEMFNYRQREMVQWISERFPDPIHPIDGIVVKLLLTARFEAMRENGYNIASIDWTKVEEGTFPEFFIPPAITPGLKRTALYAGLAKMLRTNPAEYWANEQVHLLDVLTRLRNRDVNNMPLDMIVDYITETFHHFHYFIKMRYGFFSRNRIPNDLLITLLNKMFGQEAKEIHDSLIAGIPCITTEINNKLRQLAYEAEKYPQVKELLMRGELIKLRKGLVSAEGGVEFLTAFNDFLKKYGERETYMGLGGIACPTWQDEPEIVFGLIRNVLNEDPDEYETRERELQARIRLAEERVFAKLDTGIWNLVPMKRFVKSLIEHARNFAIFRENSHYDMTRGMHVFRILFMELGDRLTKRGILNNKEDIVYLTYHEIREIVTTVNNGLEEVDTKLLGLKLKERKGEQEQRLARWKTRHKANNTDADIIQGVPASGGTVTGRARIIEDPRDFGSLLPGEILVARFTNPAWTPLFTTASGLVVDTGGASSHAAIIAREYGIPAIMGTENATQTIKNGDKITVNGSTGLVLRVLPKGA